MVTVTGYQSGVVQFAAHYGIDLKLLRRPTAEDWSGKVKDIVVELKFRGVVSSDEKPIVIQMKLGAKDAEEETHLLALKAQGRLSIETAPDTVFYDSDRNVITSELRWWLPRQLGILNKPDGGPYTDKIDLGNHCVLVNHGEPDEVIRAYRIP